MKSLTEPRKGALVGKSRLGDCGCGAGGSCGVVSGCRAVGGLGCGVDVIVDLEVGVLVMVVGSLC